MLMMMMRMLMMMLMMLMMLMMMLMLMLMLMMLMMMRMMMRKKEKEKEKEKDILREKSNNPNLKGGEKRKPSFSRSYHGSILRAGGVDGGGAGARTPLAAAVNISH